MPVHLVAPQLALAVGAAVVLLVALVLPRARQSLCAPLALAVLLAAAIATAVLDHATSETLAFSGTWARDGITTWSTHAILAVTALVVGLSPRWLSGDRRHGEWYAMLLLAALGATLLAGAADLMEVMVAMLLSSATGYTLASWHRGSRMSAEAGAKLYFLGALSNPLLYLGIVVLYGLAASTQHATLAVALAEPSVDPLALAVGVGLLLVGLSFELGVVPVHPWVPDVAQGSPAPAAAFLTVAPKIGTLVAFARIASVLPDEGLPWRAVVAVVAALTMTLGNLAALWQHDVRRLLGWSSVSQAGYGLMAVVAVGRAELALPALVVFVIGYALANVAAFAVVVALRGRTELHDYEGLAHHRPAQAIALTLALLSLAGIPPLVGFTAKLALFGAAIEAGYAWLAVLAVLNTVLSLAYYLRVVGRMFLAPAREPAALLGWPSRVTVALASLLVVAIGVGAQLLLDAASSATLLPG